MHTIYGQIVKTKLVPPKVTDHILFRPTLSKRFKKIQEHTLTIIHSGPGTGKSTALSSFLCHESVPSCWLSLTEHDDHLFRFFQYMTEAVRMRHEPFAESLSTDFFQKLQLTQEQDIYATCSAFINELMAIDEELILVIDDYHLVENTREIETFLKWLILHLPDHIHLVVVSRTRPDWDFITSLKLKGRLCELSENDFSFSRDEITVLFEDHYGYPLSPKAVQRIYERTEGWIIAIQMIWQQLNEGVELTEILENETNTMHELFQFMVLEVMVNQPNEVQSFMKQSSILETITTASCKGALHRDDGGKIIKYLHAKNLFLVKVGEGEFRYHSLFKECLYEQLKKEPEEYKKLHRQAGGYFAQSHQVEVALRHFKQIDDHLSIAKLIVENGEFLLKEGSLEGFLQTLQELPVQLKDSYPAIWGYEGDIYRFRSLYEKALLCYERAEEIAKAAGDIAGESIGLEGKARIYLDTIQPKQANKWLRSVIELQEKIEDGPSERLIQLYTLMAENAINLGKAQEAEIWYEKSREIQNDFYEEELEARILLRTGRLTSTRKLLEKALCEEEYGAHDRLPRSHRETNLLLSLVYSFVGEGEKAKIAAESGIMQGVKNKSPFVEACGWIRMGHAVQITSPEKVKLSEQCYRTALSIMDDINMSRGKAEPYLGLCLLYGRRKNLKLSLQYSEEALRETEKVDDLWLSSLVRICRGVSFIQAEKFEEASKEFVICYRNFQQCGDSYGLTVTLLWQSYIAHHLKEEESFYTTIMQMLQLVENEGYSHLFSKSTFLGSTDVQKLSPMLLDAQQKKVENPYLEQLLVNMGIEDMSSHPGYTLRIKTLGTFEIYLGDELITEKNWKREKSKELFQLFMTKRKYLLPKNEIFATLWKDHKEDVAERDFKVALNTLNKVLEPGRKARSQPFFIQRHANTYGFNLAAPFELDAAKFEHGVTKGLSEGDVEQALPILKSALDMYEGDYLPGRANEDWCIEERERLQVLFLRGAERLSELYILKEDFNEAIRWCEHILLKDKCWEEAYRLLMKSYLLKNNRSSAIRWYEKCKQVLADELGVQPMEPTVKFYEKLMREA
ncbi:BTAD domain-containing putative transcriptional regulator [Evansella halocellulosilytica]|uniref:BTAD domain-containing putative transcriptional regulator n=1 Tax=Evansella halocellulosilytica TaxID=2011013 RepID=UPI0015CD6F1C|nr:BTAD domain-containing putative transcriptional regulator [Evansella halocellulosilytica]